MASGLSSPVSHATTPKLPRRLNTQPTVAPLSAKSTYSTWVHFGTSPNRRSSRAALLPSASRRPAGAPPPPASPGAPPAPPSHGLVATLPLTEGEYVEVGTVSGAHGVQGELKLDVTTDEPAKRFKAGRKLFLQAPSSGGLSAQPAQGAASLIPVVSKGAKVRPLGKGVDSWIVALQEVTSRTQAELLRGYVVFCAATDRDRLRDPDEFYVTDLIGCTVVDQASRRMVGLVVDVYSGMGTHDTLRVKLRASEQDILNSRIRYCLIPFAKAICPVVDLPGRLLQVAPPEGLLDLTSEEPLRRPLSDETKAQKLQQLREQLRKEEAEAAARGQQQEQQPAAAASGRQEQKQEGDSSSAREDAEPEEGEGEEEEGEEVPKARLRRPGLRRRSGAVRLGLRRRG